MGVLENSAKTVSGVVDAMRSQPMAIALIVMNFGLLVYLYYYTNRITARTEFTVNQMFDANNRLFAQFGIIIKDASMLTEKTMHCILPEDVIKLQRIQPQSAPVEPVPLPPPRPTPLRLPLPDLAPPIPLLLEEPN